MAWWRLVGSILVFVVLSSAAAEALPVLRAVRVITTPEQTRFVIQFSEPVEHHLERQAAQPELGVPERVVIDFPGARVAEPAPLPKTLAQGPAVRIRATRVADSVRLLIDVPGLEDAGTFFLPDPFRLIVDVRGTPRFGAVQPTAKPTTTPVPLPQDIATIALPRTPTLAVPVAVAALPPTPVGPEAGRPNSTPAPIPPHGHPVKIVLDAGHGGKDPGASGVAGVAEKDIVLAIARRLRDRLRRELGYQVVMTRDRDVFIALEERTAIANAARADLFISIHANASPNEAAAGIETYYLRNTDDRATLRLAAMENGLRAMAGSGASDDGAALILSDMIQNYKIQESTTLAEKVQERLVSGVRRGHDDVNDLGVKRGPFYVLVGAGMPCVLAEVGFVTHPIEGQRLVAPDYQALLVDGLLRGIQASVENARAAGNL
jgi:N-acetylmuramoyl-L-alanine amidase